MNNVFVIAIDGPAASGKGTLAHRLGAAFDCAVLDTGLLYRFVGVALARVGITPDQADQAGARARDLAAEMTPAALESPDLRGAQAAHEASVYSAIPGVRAALTDYQRNFAQNPPVLPDGRPARGAILDGRDIGTVICPDATLKLYVTADVTERACRRTADLSARGFAADYETVLADLKTRDARDSTRLVAPTRPALDAHILDTTALSADAAFEAAAQLARPLFNKYGN